MGFCIVDLERYFQPKFKKYNFDLARGDLCWVLAGIRHELCLIIEVHGSIYHKSILDFKYIVLQGGIIKEYKGWKLEKIGYD